MKLFKWLFRAEKTTCNINERYSNYLLSKNKSLKDYSTLIGGLRCCSNVNLTVELKKANKLGRKKLIQLIEDELNKRR